MLLLTLCNYDNCNLHNYKNAVHCNHQKIKICDRHDVYNLRAPPEPCICFTIATKDDADILETFLMTYAQRSCIIIARMIENFTKIGAEYHQKYQSETPGSCADRDGMCTRSLALQIGAKENRFHGFPWFCLYFLGHGL